MKSVWKIKYFKIYS